MKKVYLALLFVLFFATAALAKININTATVDELASLNGIGKVKAEAIVAYRKVHGEFKTLKDLTSVKGIGEKTVEKLKDQIEISK